MKPKLDCSLEDKLEKRKLGDVTLFLIFTFSFVLLLTLFSAYNMYRGLEPPTSDVQMLTPAMTVMVVAKLRDKNSSYPKLTFNYYLMGSFLIVCFACFGQLIGIGDYYFNRMLFVSIFVLSVFFVPVLLNDNEEQAKRWKIRGGNFRNTLKWIVLFMFFCYIYIFVMQLAIRKIDSSYSGLFVLENPISIVSGSLFSWAFFLKFFGEDYAWRFFLQPRLQKRFGKIKGILLLGVIWGVWHFNFLVPTFIMGIPVPEDYLLRAILMRIAINVSVAIVGAYFYEKSGSIWCISFIHCLYSRFPIEGFAPIFLQSDYKQIAIIVILNFAIISLFFFSKVFREDKNLQQVNG